MRFYLKMVMDNGDDYHRDSEFKIEEFESEILAMGESIRRQIKQISEKEKEFLRRKP